MSGRILALAVGIALLGGCSGGVSQTVERPLDEVEGMLTSADSMGLAGHLPGTAQWLEQTPGRLIWHFTLDGKDYARLVVSLAEKGPGATQVSTAFEEVDDATGQGLPYLREVAKAVGEESVAASIEGRPLNLAALENRYKLQAATNPTAVVGATRQIWDEAIEIGKENGSPSSTGPRQAYDKPQTYDATQPYDRTDQ